MYTEKAGGEPKKRNNSVVIAKTLDHNQSQEKVDSLRSLRRETFCAGCPLFSAKSNLPKIGKNIVKKVRQRKGPTLGMIPQDGQSGGRLCRTSKKAWDLHKNMYKVKQMEKRAPDGVRGGSRSLKYRQGDR